MYGANVPAADSPKTITVNTSDKVGQEGALPRNEPVATASESEEDRRLMKAADKRGEDPTNNGDGGGGWMEQVEPTAACEKQKNTLVVLATLFTQGILYAYLPRAACVQEKSARKKKIQIFASFIAVALPIARCVRSFRVEHLHLKTVVCLL